MDRTLITNTLYAAAGIYLDISKNLIPSEQLDELFQFAKKSRLETAIEDLFHGKIVNKSQSQAALHIHLRDRPDLSALEKLVTEIHAHDYDTIVHVGVGGSYLGPELLSNALRDYWNTKYQVHFVTGIDEAEWTDLLATINLTRTLFVFVSKSFSTRETIAVAKKIIGKVKPEQCVAVTAWAEKALAFGIPEQNILTMPREVGGRFSLWSAVSLTVVLQIGLDNFKRLLAGAHAMDQHFLKTDFTQNLPVLLALVNYWCGVQRNAHSRCIVPYGFRLRHLPAYLQQLHMESLGKSHLQNNQPVAHLTGGIIWGGAATPAQHSFFQLLLQGTHCLPIDFVLPLRDCAGQINHELITQCIGQSELLTRGETTSNVAHRINGGQPHNILLLQQLNPFTLGALLALYEHKVYVMSVLWGINAFDQWGVETGKTVIDRLSSSLQVNQFLKASIDKLCSEVVDA